MVKAPTRNARSNLLNLLDDPVVQEQLRQICQEKSGNGSPLDSTLPDDRPAAHSTEIAQLYKLVFEAIQQQNKAIEQQTRTYAQVGRAVGVIQGTARAGREWGTVARDAQDVGRMVLLGGAAIALTLFVFVLTLTSIKNAVIQALGFEKGTDPASTLFTSVKDVPPVLENGTVLGIAVTSGFGMRQHPVTKRERMHEGIDIGLEVGRPLYAVASTIVECLEDPQGYGSYARYAIDDQHQVILGHLTPGSCIRGSAGAGELIGYSGNSGLSTAPHLHLQVEEDGTPKVPTLDVALSTLKAVPRESLNTFVAAIYPAIVEQESGGDPAASNRASGQEAIGQTQVMEYNIVPWSQQALGKAIGISEFRNSPDLQQQISLYELYQVSVEQIATSGMNTELAMRRVAAVWYSGNANRERDYSPIPNQPNSPSVGDYVYSVLERVKNAPSTKR
jgi:murein DD-endopeptidase MepM/ murein hydrolase activator NlpD